MDVVFTFTIILSLNNFDAFSLKTLDSIIKNQSLDFQDNVQLIIIVPENTLYSSITPYLDDYPENIILMHCKSRTIDYQKILNNTRAKYVLFLSNNNILSNNALKDAEIIFEREIVDVIFLLNKEFMDKKNYPNGHMLFDLNQKNNLIPLRDSIFFMSTQILENILTQDNSGDLWSIIVKIMDIQSKYAVIQQSNYILQYSEVKSGENYNKNSFHEDKLNNFYFDLIEYSNQKYGHLSSFIQELFIYQLSYLIEEFDVNLLNNKEKDSFFKSLYGIVSQLDSNIIRYYYHVDSRKKNFLLYLHNKCNMVLEYKNNHLDLKIGEHLIDKLDRHKIWLDLIDINGDVLNISGLLQSNFPNNDISIKIISQNNHKQKLFDCTLLVYTQDERKNISYLSIDWVYRYNFDFSIPLYEVVDSKLSFVVNFDNGDERFSYNPEIAFRTPASMSTSSIYQTNENYIIYFKDNSFNIRVNNYPLLLKLEFSNLKKIIKDKRTGYLTAILIRGIYVLLYPFMHKRMIWLFNDRLTFADDNAICLYDYAIKQEDNIQKYFIISDKSRDYPILKRKYSNIISYGSLKHRILYLFANKLVYSFVNEDYSNPFHIPKNLDYKQLYSGLFSFKRYFLQHGVTLGDVSDSIKKYNLNLSLIDTSSILEAQSYKVSSYGFSYGVIQTLGLPRYDKLENTICKKQIIFMPTWRSYLNYDESLFKYSKFYKTVSDLLSNERLHKLLDNQGYELVFKPHPELYKYLHHFSLENIKLSDESYRQLFNESALLITDYSSVFFDFAYLKKPVIYYQNSDDYHYKKGYFDFESMGFGEVISDENELIDKIEKYIENDCIMEKKYEERVDEFFSYHDQENCKRVYSWIKNN